MTSTSRNPWSLRQKLIMGVVSVISVLALSIGLGAGLTIGRGHHHWSQSSSSSTSTTSTSSAPISTPSEVNGTESTGLWQPMKGTSWNYELQTPLSSSSKGNFDVWDIDLFDNDAGTISSFQQQGAKVICYFSAGSAENWRPDYSKFAASDLGNDLSGWPGEKWVNINSPSVRQIMEVRLDLAKQKNCDGVDPDNVDGYNNDNGLDLTQADSIDYIHFFADAAQQRGLSIGLKNSAEIVVSVIDAMQWSVNEQCIEFNECDSFKPFITQGKPVFHVEYPKGDNTNNNMPVSGSTSKEVCDASQASGFSTIIKNIDLDGWTEPC
jgi:uncharacterized protein (TIGR01370 family)